MNNYDNYTKTLIIAKLEKFLEYLEEREFHTIDNKLIKGLQEKAILKDIQTDLNECREIIRDLAND